MDTTYHPHLLKVLQKVVASEEAEKQSLKTAIDLMINDYLNDIAEWLDYIDDLLNAKKQLSVSAVENDDDFVLCQFAIEDWISQDRAMGMRYNALVKRYEKTTSGLSSVIVLQTVSEQLEAHKDKIHALAIRANELARQWREKLATNRYHELIATQLEWLSKVTKEELIKNYKRWEKEKL